MATTSPGVDEDRIKELLQAIPEELTNELLEMEQECIAKEEAREKETAATEEFPGKFTVKGLADVFADLNKLLKNFEDIDPSTGRFLLLERNVYDIVSAYNKIYDEKKKQTKQTITNLFLKGVTPPQDKLQEGPSGGVPEEGSVITGDDSPMCVTVPEDLPREEVVEMEQ